jgi:hypothetical protein
MFVYLLKTNDRMHCNSDLPLVRPARVTTVNQNYPKEMPSYPTKFQTIFLTLYPQSQYLHNITCTQLKHIESIDGKSAIAVITELNVIVVRENSR